MPISSIEGVRIQQPLQAAPTYSSDGQPRQQPSARNWRRRGFRSLDQLPFTHCRGWNPSGLLHFRLIELEARTLMTL